MTAAERLQQEKDLRKSKLRSAVVDMYTKGKDDQFVLNTGYKFGYDMKEVQDEIDSYKKAFGKEGVASGSATVSSATAADLGDSQAARGMLDTLSKSIEQNKGNLGPVEGRLRALNPYDTNTQTVQGIINSTKQIVGKYLEGGVLRLEDEKKYEKILPTLADTPDVAMAKLKTVQGLIEAKETSQIKSLGSAGYNVSGYNQQPSAPQPYQQTQAPVQPMPQQPTQPVQAQAMQPTDLLRPVANAGKFLGMENFGKGIGNAAFLYMTQEGRDIMKRAADGDQQALASLQAVLSDTPTNKQIIGSAANTALNAVSGGAVSGAPALTSAGKVAAGGVLGGAYGMAGGLDQNKDALGIAKETAIGAGSGAALSGIGVMLSKLGKGGQTAAERLYNSAVKPSLDDTKKAITYGGKTLGRELLDQGIAGGNEKLLRKATDGLHTNEKQLQTLLKGSDAVITRDEVSPFLDKLRKKLAETPTPKAQAALQNIDETIKLLPEKFSVADANKFKRNIYAELKDVAYKIDPKLAPQAEQNKAIANGLKNLIENKVGSKEVIKLNQNLATYNKLQDSVVDNIARKMRNNIAGVGTVGSIIEKLTGGVASKTYGAAVVDAASKKLIKTVNGNTGKITKAMVLNALREAQKN